MHVYTVLYIHTGCLELLREREIKFQVAWSKGGNNKRALLTIFALWYQKKKGKKKQYLPESPEIGHTNIALRIHRLHTYICVHIFLDKEPR